MRPNLFLRHRADYEEPLDGAGPFRRSRSEDALARAERFLGKDLSSPRTLIRLDDIRKYQETAKAAEDLNDVEQGQCPCKNLTQALELQFLQWKKRWQANEEAIRRLQQDHQHQWQQLQDLQTRQWVANLQEEVVINNEEPPLEEVE